MKTWTMTEARAKFYELLRLAQHEGPQEITRRGKDAVFVMSYEDWLKATSAKPTVSKS